MVWPITARGAVYRHSPPRLTGDVVDECGELKGSPRGRTSDRHIPWVPIIRGKTFGLAVSAVGFKDRRVDDSF